VKAFLRSLKEDQSTTVVSRNGGDNKNTISHGTNSAVFNAVRHLVKPRVRAREGAIASIHGVLKVLKRRLEAFRVHTLSWRPLSQPSRK